MLDLNKMARDALETAMKREEKGQLKSDTMSILKHCAGEVLEAVDEYTRRYPKHHSYSAPLYRDEFGEELADVITCALIAAAKEGVDIEAALLRVQEKNQRRTK